MKQITKYVIKNSLKRIFLYRASLVRLKLMGVKKVFSYTLANETGVKADQVRKDFSEYGIKGNKRGGYEVEELLEIMENIFHRNKDHNLVLVGMGNMGLALSKSRTRDPERMDYGCYRIVDTKTGDVIAGRYPYAYSLDLNACEEALDDIECALADREAKEQSLRARKAAGAIDAKYDQ